MAVRKWYAEENIQNITNAIRAADGTEEKALKIVSGEEERARSAERDLSSRISGLSSRLTRLTEEVRAVCGRSDGPSAADTRISELSDGMDGLSERMDGMTARLDSMSSIDIPTEMVHIGERFDEIGQRFDSAECRTEQLSDRVSALENGGVHPSVKAANAPRWGSIEGIVTDQTDLMEAIHLCIPAEKDMSPYVTKDDVAHLITKEEHEAEVATLSAFFKAEASAYTDTKVSELWTAASETFQPKDDYATVFLIDSAVLDLRREIAGLKPGISRGDVSDMLAAYATAESLDKEIRSVRSIIPKDSIGRSDVMGILGDYVSKDELDGLVRAIDADETDEYRNMIGGIKGELAELKADIARFTDYAQAISEGDYAGMKDIEDMARLSDLESCITAKDISGLISRQEVLELLVPITGALADKAETDERQDADMVTHEELASAVEGLADTESVQTYVDGKLAALTAGLAGIVSSAQKTEVRTEVVTDTSVTDALSARMSEMSAELTERMDDLDERVSDLEGDVATITELLAPLGEIIMGYAQMKKDIEELKNRK